ncbi:hypothetical protein ACFYXF_48225 [Streptomyces sp. NPDC002680]|uniref:hypothetical protein n=1 Tax=Streptomyces sp. NPDC002680 TaxID=3364659 RepID=UPI00368E33F1
MGVRPGRGDGGSRGAPGIPRRGREEGRELVRAAEALYLHGPAYQDLDEGAKHAFVNGGFFVYMVTPRSELVSIWQITPDPYLHD